MAGMFISLTAVQSWLVDEQLKKKVTEEVLSGKKKMCLAITEAFAGSDVGGIRTTATKNRDGSWVINGTKKWITSMTISHPVPAYMANNTRRRILRLFRGWLQDREGLYRIARRTTRRCRHEEDQDELLNVSILDSDLLIQLTNIPPAQQEQHTSSSKTCKSPQTTFSAKNPTASRSSCQISTTSDGP